LVVLNSCILLEAQELDTKGYVCPQCKRVYSTLDAMLLMDHTRGCFTCEDCRAEVLENENAESVKGSQDRMQRFNHDLAFIQGGLKKTDKMVLPAFDVQDWLRKHPSEEAKRAQERDGLKNAGENSAKKEDGMEVVLTEDKDEATKRAEREKEAEAKMYGLLFLFLLIFYPNLNNRKQNSMPSWHARSTVTGELTALGHAAVTQSTSQLSPTSGSNATILESLTNPGSRPAPRAGASSNAAILSNLGKAPKIPTNNETSVKLEVDSKVEASNQPHCTFFLFGYVFLSF